MKYLQANYIPLMMFLALSVALLLGFDPATLGAAGIAVALATAGKNAEPETLRKITVKAIGAAPDFEKLMEAPGKRMDLADVYGIATKAKPGTSDLGGFVAFLGDFRAVRLSDKVAFQSRKIILPRFIEEELFGAFDPEGNGNVEFAFRLSAKFDKDAATKYVYEMKPIIKAASSAQMAALESRVKEEAKALPAPK